MRLRRSRPTLASAYLMHGPERPARPDSHRLCVFSPTHQGQQLYPGRLRFIQEDSRSPLTPIPMLLFPDLPYSYRF